MAFKDPAADVRADAAERGAAAPPAGAAHEHEPLPPDALDNMEFNVESDRRRTASWQDAAYHSLTAMVGAGVLGLPATFVHLGWAGGIIMLLFSFWVSWYTYRLLVYMHEFPLSESKAPGGWARFDRYQQLTCYVFGRRAGKWALLPFQAGVCVGIAITYTVVGGDDLFAIIKDCVPNTNVAPWMMYLAFGGAQILLSQLPDFSALGFVSALGALMSVCYCAIATGLAAAYRPAGPVDFSPKHDTPVEQRVFDIFAAITTMLFAYGGHNIALEIQATLPSPPTIRRMMRGVHIAFVVTGILYFCVAISGYAAMGASAGSNIIISLNNGPLWVRNLARAMVVVHVLAAYQVYTHPVFDWIETGAGRIKGLGAVFHYGSWPSRLALRTSYVGLITLVAIVVPFFGDLMALIGAIAITPTTYLLPPLLWLLLKKPARWGFEWLINVGLVASTAAIGVMGTISAVYLLITHAKEFHVLAV